MRGGTSKGVFFREDALPPPGSERDTLFLAVIGSPDPYGRQLDGLGGGISSLSKVVSVAVSTRPDADVDYTFGQVAIDKPAIDYSANCGNLSAAVGPFAVNEGLVPSPDDGEFTVRLYNTNTASVIRATIQVRDGKARADGDFVIPGVAEPGAAVKLDYLSPGGSTTGAVLPTGEARTVLAVGATEVIASCVDAAVPLVIVRAEDVGCTGGESVETLAADQELLAALDGLRRAGAVAMGLATDPAGTALASPKVVIVGPPTSYRTLSGEALLPGSHDLAVRMISMEQVHRAVPGTGALCLAVAVQIPETVAHSTSSAARNEPLRLGTPSGVVTVVADVDITGEAPVARSASMYRTARTLMRGEVPWPTNGDGAA